MDLKLYVITGTAPDDLTYDLSLIVFAETVEEAEGFWCGYYELEEGTRPERVFHFMPNTTFAYPEGPVGWNSEFLPQVGGTE